MRVLVCGGRHFGNRALVYQTLDDLAKREVVDAIIEGDASGADRLAGYWARQRGIDNIKFRADWTLGRSAGPVRNMKMLKEGNPSLVIAFPGGKGTADMVARARESGIEVVEITQ